MSLAASRLAVDIASAVRMVSRSTHSTFSRIFNDGTSPVSDAHRFIGHGRTREDRIRRQHHGTLDGVFEFSDVAGPAIVHERRHHAVLDCIDRLPHRMACLRMKWTTSIGMSWMRSRSGGTSIGMTCSR